MRILNTFRLLLRGISSPLEYVIRNAVPLSLAGANRAEPRLAGIRCQTPFLGTNQKNRIPH
jgi:hypothetical protein